MEERGLGILQARGDTIGLIYIQKHNGDLNNGPTQANGSRASYKQKEPETHWTGNHQRKLQAMNTDSGCFYTFNFPLKYKSIANIPQQETLSKTSTFLLAFCPSPSSLPTWQDRFSASGHQEGGGGQGGGHFLSWHVLPVQASQTASITIKEGGRGGADMGKIVLFSFLGWEICKLYNVHNVSCCWHIS